MSGPDDRGDAPALTVTWDERYWLAADREFITYGTGATILDAVEDWYSSALEIVASLTDEQLGNKLNRRYVWLRTVLGAGS